MNKPLGRYASWLAAVFMAGAMGLSAKAETVAYFTFDNIANNQFTDVMGNGLVGTLGFSPEEGAPLVVPGPSGAEDDLAAEIPVGEGMAVNDVFFDLLYIPPMTFEVWVRSGGFTASEPGASHVIFDYAGSYELGVNGDDNIYFNIGGTSLDSGVSFPFDNEWHHLAVVVDDLAPIVEIFLDGESIASVAEAPLDAGGTDSTFLVGRGGITPNNLAFEGAVDRLRISQVALSADDLDSDAANPKEVGPDVRAAFLFDEGELPYAAQGIAEGLEMVSVRAFTQGNAGAPVVTEDTPSGQDGDFALFFENQAFANVRDPNYILDVGGEGNDWTLEAWVKYEDVTSGRMVMFYYGPGAYSFSLSGGDPRLVFVTTLRIADFPSQNAVVPVGEWAHVAVAHVAGESLSFFVNGELIEVNDYTGGSNTTEAPNLSIGSEPNGVLPFTGWLDRIRISNVALTAEELDSDPTMTVPVSHWSIH